MPQSQPELLTTLVSTFQAAATGAGLRVDTVTIQRVVASLMSKRFLIAAGLAGSGKTKVAQALANWLTPRTVARDPFWPGATIPAANVNYYVKAADSLSVEFWNSTNAAEAIRVVLPRAMIREWADHIRRNNLSRDVQARALREAVKSTSPYALLKSPAHFL